MKNIAIILAGGSGSRFGEKTPKQFLKVAGKSVIEHTVDAFEKNPLIDEIVVEIVERHGAKAYSFNYLKQSKGHLLFYTSSSYTRGRAFYSMYSSTKAATVNFVQALAQEWEKSEIRVNVINPQRTKTPMRIKNFGNEPDKTLLSAEKVAEVSIKTLLSNFTGQIIDVKKDVSDTGLH